MILEDIMTRSVRSVEPTAEAEAAWRVMQSGGIHHLVVLERGAVVGVISHRDLGGARGASVRAGKCVADLMTPSVISAAPETSLRRAANLLRGRAIGCLPIVDGKRLVGIVTTTDLLDLLCRGPDHPRAVPPRTTPRRRASGTMRT